MKGHRAYHANSLTPSSTDIISPELLLQLADKSGLDLVEVLKLSEGDEDDNSLAAATDLELLGSRDVKITEISLQLVGRHLHTREYK